MSLSAVPTDYYDDHQTSLFQSMTSSTQTSGIILTALTRNNATVTWVATNGILRFTDGTLVEHIGFDGISVDSTTKNVTLTGVTRDLVWNGTGWTTGSAGQQWSAGVQVELVADARFFRQAALKDQANTFTAGTQTFQAPIVISGATSYIQVPSLTTSQRDALTAANGQIIYNSTTGVMNQYIGGAWTTFATGTTPNAANGVAGKVDIATAAEIAAGTATDPTSGAVNVIPVSQTAKTSSGASDENKLPVLNASGQLASGFVNITTTVTDVFGTGADGAATISANTSLAADKNYTDLTINNTFSLNPAGYIIRVNGTLTLTGNIASPGGNGGAGGNGVNTGTAGAAGAAGTAAHSAGTLPGSIAGVAGGAGAVNNATGNAGAAGTAEASGALSAGTAGGAGGAGNNSGGVGGAGGTVTATAPKSFQDIQLNHAGSTASRNLAGSGGSGGGGGGGGVTTGTCGGGGGGGSGGNGGNILIYAKTITGAGNITATGGTGGAGGIGASSGNPVGGGGGGTGGSGGYITIFYSSKTGWSGTATAAGGAGGAGGAGANGGSTGTAGSTGTSGSVFTIQI